MTTFDEKRNTLILSIDKAIHRSTDDKAMVQLKYDRLNFKNNFVQISVIVVSTLITFIETIKASYEINEYASMLLPIFASTYIALVVAIIRFLKYDDKRETMANILERFSYIINKYKKTKHDFKFFEYSEENKKEWDNMLLIYHTETYDFYNQTREMYDNAMSFKEKVYYKEKLKLLHIDAMFNDRDHVNITQNRDVQHRQHIQQKTLLSGCCKKNKKDYQDILNKFDSIYDEDESITVKVEEIKKPPALPLTEDNSPEDNSPKDNSPEDNSPEDNTIEDNKKSVSVSVI